MKNRFLDEHCDTLDADVFTGDALFDEDDLKEFEEYLARWGRKVTEFKEMIAETKGDDAHLG
jgi:hypothetical protein